MSPTSTTPLDLSRPSSPSLESFSGASDVESDTLSAIIDTSEGPQLVSSVANKRIPCYDAVTNGPVPVPDGREACSVARLECEGTRREGFYHLATFVVFFVQGFIYRIYSGFLTGRSAHWAQKLAAPDYVNAPVAVHDVSPHNMDTFLTMVQSPHKPSPDSKTYEEWAAILRLATELHIDDIRDSAIEGLSLLASPINKLVLGRVFNVQDWLHPAFVELCVRPEPLTLEEVKVLPLEDVVHIMSAREAVRHRRLNPPNKNDVSFYVAKHILNLPDGGADRPSSSDTGEKSPRRVGEPRPLQGLSVPPTEEQLRVLAEWLDQCYVESPRYSVIISILEEHNIDTFCDVLMNFSLVLRHGYEIQCFTRALLHHGVVTPEFVPVGVNLLSAISSVLCRSEHSAPGECKYLTDELFKSRLVAIIANVKTVWDAMNSETSIYDNFELRLRHSSSQNHTMRYDFEGVVGSCNYLVQHKDVYEARSSNLRTFIAALVEAGLVTGLDP